MTLPPPRSTDSDSCLTGDEAEHGVGLSNPRISASRRQMLDLVNRLHNTGVQIHIDLPRIVVIGSQSAGKSSLIESISGITLPRAAGTCTRCPTECRLSHSDSPWKCMVELRFFTDADGQTRGQPRIERFGAPIFDKSQVEERIRRAQRAILHPKKPASTFLEGDTDDSTDVSFSANCISLQISGPEIGDLSFVDLPGLIASSKHQGDTDVGIVKGLVTSYISNPSCIILVTVACETDFENQDALQTSKTRLDTPPVMKH
ncbi:P-loop containing nucleoside triphosphate hydrolase protein [Mycena polygramma]|nr:P-loop containing nucleoside triphosphate hydrolase protein [Mycena polygramma]